MDDYIRLLLFIVIGVLLLWFGYTLFFRLKGKKGKYPPYKKPAAESGKKGRHTEKSGTPGASQTCPVCSAELTGGDQVKTTAFPALNKGKDRLMHIHGCIYCLNGERGRICPVCGADVALDEFLAARIFDRALRHSHVHIIGCPHCRKVK